MNRVTGWRTVTADIEGSLHVFLCRRSRATRYASFDYCFNYFQDARDAQETAGLARGDQLELSCLHLGFYLASWGMMRGRAACTAAACRNWSESCRRSPTSPPPPGNWMFPATPRRASARCSHSPANQGRVHLHRQPRPRHQDDARRLRLHPSLRPLLPPWFRRCRLDRATPTMISDFYTAHRRRPPHAARIPTLDFTTGTDTRRCYTQAKIIDMIFFQEGYRRTGKVRD